VLGNFNDIKNKLSEANLKFQMVNFLYKILDTIAAEKSRKPVFRITILLTYSSGAQSAW
jgi:hypothetical protein